ncbi:MAG TPA: methionine adenosyltransferase [Candidatus Paceibacterota bacterium]
MSFIIGKTYTVESVTSGHPDKVCDQISDAVLDACLAQDPMSRVAVETFGSHGHLVIGGEVTTRAKIDYAKIAAAIYKKIGYDKPLEIKVVVAEQSPDIAMGVDTGGAGDQGIMYGYASDETPEYLPTGVVLTHKLAEGLEALRKSKKVKWLKPDGKTQVTYINGKLKTVLVSCQHDKKVTQEEIKKVITAKLINPIVKKVTGKLPAKDVNILVNPTGSFIPGGFEADAGLTGRKIMVDTYGGLAPHGGGAFSGKDLTKVDRSAAYMARYVAKNLVANGYAKQCLVSVAYAIGKVEPLMVSATDEKGKDLSKILEGKFDFRPKAIIEHLGLRQPIFSQTAAYGHFGKKGLPWEKVVRM